MSNKNVILVPLAIVGIGSAVLLATLGTADAQQNPTRRQANAAPPATGAVTPAARPAPAPQQASPAEPAAASSEKAGSDQAAIAGVEVTGFRSAKFGMKEDDVKAAILKDFRAKPEAIRAEDNKLERTRVLIVPVQDVLPGGGAAEVSYVFGYESKKLIQTGITWSKASDAKMTAEQLYSNANVLRSHFVGAGYKPDTVAMNMPVNNGLLMFRGSDGEGRTTLLMLQGSITQGEANSGQRVLTPASLSLFYIADAKKPDVYRLPPGSF